MTRRLCAYLLLLSMVTLGGCASLLSVSFTHVPKARGHVVTSRSHDWAMFNLHSSNDFVDTVRQGLLDKCPGGNITGILTKYETMTYVFMVKRIVTATGFCNEDNASNVDGGSSERPSDMPPPPPPPPPPADSPETPNESPPAQAP